MPFKHNKPLPKNGEAETQLSNLREGLLSHARGTCLREALNVLIKWNHTPDRHRYLSLPGAKYLEMLGSEETIRVTTVKCLDVLFEQKKCHMMRWAKQVLMP